LSQVREHFHGRPILVKYTFQTMHMYMYGHSIKRFRDPKIWNVVKGHKH